MFTVADICNIAIQIEKNGEETYRRAGETVQNAEIASILNWMADQEQKHARWFKSIRTTKPLSAEQMEAEAIGKNLLQEMVKGNDFLLRQSELERFQSIAEVLAKSKTFERDTIIFYKFLLDLVDEEDSIQLLNKIIEEETNHIRELERLEKS